MRSGGSTFICCRSSQLLIDAQGRSALRVRNNDAAAVRALGAWAEPTGCNFAPMIARSGLRVSPDGVACASGAIAWHCQFVSDALSLAHNTIGRAEQEDAAQYARQAEAFKPLYKAAARVRASPSAGIITATEE